jgi:hypothetical protein
MKKLTRFLILFILLIFSNYSSASFFGDIFREIISTHKEYFKIKSTHKEYFAIRCKVEYTQLDLTTGLEKVIKNTIQFELEPIENLDYCYIATQDFVEKINEWLNESPNNIITNSTIILCKEKVRNVSQWVYFKSDKYWEEYKSCKDEINVKIIDWIEHPKQQGFNIHKERLINNTNKEFEQKTEYETNFWGF